MPKTSGEQLTAHFRRDEFACPDGCGFDAINRGLVDGLESLRLKTGKPIKIWSGCRCGKHNAAVGGAPASAHLYGVAADISILGMSARELYQAARSIPQFRGFGVDDARRMLHVDARIIPARWCYHDGKPVAWNEGANSGTNNDPK